MIWASHFDLTIGHHTVFCIPFEAIPDSSNKRCEWWALHGYHHIEFPFSECSINNRNDPWHFLFDKMKSPISPRANALSSPILNRSPFNRHKGNWNLLYSRSAAAIFSFDAIFVKISFSLFDLGGGFLLKFGLSVSAFPFSTPSLGW